MTLGAAIPAGASSTDGEMTPTQVPSAGISIDIPAGWSSVQPPSGLAAKTADEVRTFFADSEDVWAALGVPLDELTDAQLLRLAEQSVKDTVMLAADTQGDGDNVQVKIQDGPAFSSLAEWRTISKASARASKGKLLATSKRRVGDHVAYTSLERDPWDGGGWVYYGYMEIARDDDSVVSVMFTVDGDSRRLAEAMLASVRASE